MKSSKLSPIIENALYDQSILRNIYLLTGDKNILDINTHINKFLKKYIIVLNLDRLKSFEYYNNVLFRNKINSLIINRHLQLTLNLKYFSAVENVSDIGLENLNNLYSLDLYGTFVSNVNCLKNCHILKLTHCEYIKDISMLVNIHSLDLSWCHMVTDVSMLGKVRHLKLIGCRNIQDFSKLGSVYDLDISLTNISDLKPLQTVQKLILHFCQNITDIISLDKVKILSIGYNNNISDVSHLRNVDYLRLFKLGQVKDISQLKNVSKLFIYGCELINDVSALRNVKFLSIGNLPNLKDITALGNHETLIIHGCFQLSNHRIRHLVTVRQRLDLGSEFMLNEDLDYLRRSVKNLTLYGYDD